MRLVSNIKTYIAQIDQNVSDAIKETADIIRDEAKQNAPVKTGVLRDSIESKMVNSVTAAVGTDLEYAPYQEFGTARGVPATYFLTRAFHHNERTFEKKLKEKLNEK